MRKISIWLSLMIVGFVICSNPTSAGADEKETIAMPTVTVMAKATQPIIEETPIIIKEEEPTTSYLIDVTPEEIDLMARVVMSESSILSNDAKQAVAQTIVNRVRDGRWGDTVTEVINYPNAYSTRDNGKPNADCYYAVEGALLYEGFPTDMFYFRTGKPHNFGYVYAIYGTTYFMTENEY